MSNFIDRRLNSKGKSTINRQRFLRRYNKQIKESVSEAITKRSVTDLSSGEQITIPKKNLQEPFFHHGKGGVNERIHPGNDQFVKGDKINKNQQGSGKNGSGDGDASNEGQGEDDFIFNISNEEFLNALFEGLELPNLKKTENSKILEYQTHRAGISNDGNPSNINIVRSMRQSFARRIALIKSRKNRLHALEEKLLTFNNKDESNEKKALISEIEELKMRISKVPFLDDFDLRYNSYSTKAVPTSKAVMFCLMDVSGSMDQATKDIAKRFYILLYMFLNKNYKEVDVVFIRHHTQAKEVDEQEFFYSQETGGTIVSSALELMKEIMLARYPDNEWNIYGAQASDGDNWADDSPKCKKIIQEDILPHSRYYTYIEITKRSHQTLWKEYESIAETNKDFQLQHIQSVEDIYPVFRDLFKKKVVA